MTRLEQFKTEYLKQAKAYAEKHPDYFMKGVSIETVVERMCVVIERDGIGHVNMGPVIKLTLKALGVKPTYKAADPWFKGA